METTFGLTHIASLSTEEVNHLPGACHDERSLHDAIFARRWLGVPRAADTEMLPLSVRWGWRVR